VPTVVERVEPDVLPDERTALVQFLDYFRDSLELKTDGLTDAQSATASCPPSILTITGLVRHMAEVERHWFQLVMAGRDTPRLYWDVDGHPDGDFDLVTDTTSLADAVAEWRHEIAVSSGITAAIASLDTVSVRQDWGRSVNLRWVLVHMIEEYARHCGHADLLRERIDGVVGD